MLDTSELHAVALFAVRLAAVGGGLVFLSLCLAMLCADRSRVGGLVAQQRRRRWRLT
jgi:hypothetical protein